VQLPAPPPSLHVFIRLATVVLIVAVLHFGREVLMPVTFAVLLVFLLAPLVLRLTRWGLPKGAAIIASVTLAFCVLGAIGWLITDQAFRLGQELPNYEHNLRRKIATLRQPQTPPALAELARMVEELGREIAAPAAPDAAPPAGVPAEPKPVPVEVRAASHSPLVAARDFIMPILPPLATAGVVIVFVVAMLFRREDLRDRFIQLVSAGQLNLATQAVDEAADRVSRYLRMQLVVNLAYGIPVGLGLWLIGVPNALLWGLLAILLRFIPYVGPWIAAAFPVLVTLAVDPGWTKVAMVLGLFVVMELLINNVVEVLLYGASTGISGVALLVAAVFWTWLWGIGGLVLSTPLTVCLLVLGKHVPALRSLDLILAREPALPPPAQFYQRMLSMESEDMLDLAAKFTAEHPPAKFYDEVFLPALILSEEDRHRGALAAERQAFIFQSSRELIEELERREEITAAKAAKSAAQPPAPARLPAAPVIVGVPARDAADEIAALMLGHLLRRRGLPVALFSLGSDLENADACITRHGIRAVFISGLPPSALIGTRQMGRRLRARHPGVTLLIGIWSREGNLAELHDRLALPGPAEVVTTLAAAVDHLERLAGDPQPARADATPLPAPA
jgi:predicted PurR-regulated permease PerM